MAPSSDTFGFIQDFPALGNAWSSDPLLQSILTRILPKHILDEITPDLDRFGARVVSPEVEEYVRNAEEHLPSIQQFDHWGKRVDVLRTSEGWRKVKEIACTEGINSLPYERRYGQFDRIYWAAKYFLFSPSSAMFVCPLGMTDGAARLIESLGDPYLMERAFRRLTSRDPGLFWTSGQWMTEKSGGSDISNTETTATPVRDSDLWAINGFKFFTSGTDGDLAMLLARPTDGTGVPGSKGLSLFYAEIRDEHGSMNGVRLHRLKHKLGTKAVPTTELQMVDTKARLISAPRRGVATISTILNITRLHNAMRPTAAMSRALQIVRNFARARTVGGVRLTDMPLHAGTVASMTVRYYAAAHLTWFVVVLLGRSEDASRRPEVERASGWKDDAVVLRFLTPVAKGLVAKMASGVLTEACECLGGQGYCEESGLPRLLRDSIVSSIWEGTTNVLGMDLIRALKDPMTLPAFVRATLNLLNPTPPELTPVADQVRTSLASVGEYLRRVPYEDPEGVAAGARDVLLAVGSVVAGAAMVGHAGWSGREVDRVAAERWAKVMKEERVGGEAMGVGVVGKKEREENFLLAFGEQSDGGSRL